MSTRNLEKLFNPRSVAVIGASNRPGSVGRVLMHNLLHGGFEGPIVPVNPKHGSVAGVLAFPSVQTLPMVPDLAVICTPPATVPKIVEGLGALGTRAAIVITAGLGRETMPSGASAMDEMLAAARRWGIRLLGPNCLGMLVPGIGLNASFAHQPALPGKIAFVSQSGALCTAVLDWAVPREIGFSHFISMGECVDLDFGDVLDYLGSDPDTSAILLYIESISERRKFMSAARAAARNKPVLVIKSGRYAEGAKAAASHTGALAGGDDVFFAAIRRAGMLRVYDIDQLFSTVETLARSAPLKGERLAILTNGGGLGVMAVDTLIESGGRLAELAPETVERLSAVLPATWSHGNPVDIIGDADRMRHYQALNVLLDAKEIDAVVVLHAPTATADSTEAAEAVIQAVKEHGGPRANIVLTSWVGAKAVAAGRRRFGEAGIATYSSPESAVRAFMRLVHYRRNQEMLMEVPPSAPEQFTPATDSARLVIEQALARGEGLLSEPEAKAVFAAYGIPTVETHVVKTPEEAARYAERFQGPAALKILSPDISHKSDVGGVMLDLETPEAVLHAGHAMLRRVEEAFPGARIAGFTVQRMARLKGAHELIIGVATDPLFGPVLLFGEGGTAVEVIADRAVALPPLNMNLARELVSRTRIYNLLQGYRDQAPADLETICVTLLRVSQLIIDIPEIVELDINPLFANAEGVLAVDARIKISAAADTGAARLAIRPYPKELEESFVMQDGSHLVLRPIRPEDQPAHHEFIGKLSPEDVRFRFFGSVKQLPHSQMARLTQIDYDREMAFIAEIPGGPAGGTTLGVVRTVTDPDNERAEFAVVVRSDLKGQGLGRKLMEKMIDYCRQRGTREIVGQTQTGNDRMLALAAALGFSRRAVPGEEVYELRLDLQREATAAA